MNHSLAFSSVRKPFPKVAAALLAAVALAASATPAVRGRLPNALSAVHRGTSFAGLTFSDPPTDDEFLRAGIFPQSLIPVGPTTPEENRELGTSLAAYAQSVFDGEPDAVQPLADFVARHPTSVWTPGLQVNLGAVYRKTGHFSKALVTWQSAWDASRNLTSSDGRIVGDMAGAYLSQLEAYLGRKELLAPLLDELRTRPVRGSPAELISNSSRGLAEMLSRPDVSFKCGPSALARILKSAPTSDVSESRRVLYEAPSTPNGLSLSAVQAISARAGMNYQMAYRSPGAPVVVPAVAHWKMGHYAAILAQDADNRVFVGDSTFGEDITMIQSTFDEEASGYFLVPPGSLPAGWRPVNADEGDTVWGRGNTGNNHDIYGTGRDEVQAFNNCLGGGCTRWNVEAAAVGLELRDDPVGYTPPFGPEIRFRMTYSHRDATQQGKFAYTNFGNKWTFEWLSYVVDGGGNFYGGAPYGAVCAGNNCQLTFTPNGFQQLTAAVYRRGGGEEPYFFPNTSVSNPGQVTTPQTSAEGQLSQSYLTRNVTNGVVSSFTRTLPDGSVEKFTLPLQKPGLPNTMFFLTEIDDPQGNAVKINYDTKTMRITGIVDAAGQKSTVCYTDSPTPCTSGANPPPSNLQVTQVIDPFGRSARFGYDAPTGHLTSVTDVLGIVSSYQYSPASAPNPDFITQLQTPYGVTTFSYADSTDTNPTRNVTVTETASLGNTPPRTSFVEFLQGAPCSTTSSTRVPSPSTMPGIASGSYLDSNGIQCTDGAMPDQGSGTNVTIKIPSTNVSIFNNYLQYRNTFVWNPEQYLKRTTLANPYLAARVIHWLHTDDKDLNGLTASRIPESTKDPLESRVWFTYPNQIYNQFQGQTTIAIGGTNQPSAIVRAVGDGSYQVSQYQYDNYGHVTQSVDPAGRTLSMTYDPTNNVDLLSVTNTTPGHADTLPVLTLSNYVQHRPQRVTGANGYTTQLLYNEIGQLISAMYPPNYIWTYGYTSTTGMPLPPAPACTGAHGCGFLTSVVGPAVLAAGAAVTPRYSFTYDSIGRVWTAEGPDQRLLTFSYDNADRLTTTLFPDQTTELRGYTFNGAPSLDLTSFTDRMGYTTGRQYDGFRELIEVDEPSGRATTLSYAPDGTLQTLTDPSGNATNYARDVEGRVNTVAYADGTTQWYAYDALGRVLSKSPDELAKLPGTVLYAYNVDDSISKAFVDARAPTVFAYDPAYPRLTGWSRIQGGTWAQPTCASASCTVLDEESYIYGTVGQLGANKLAQVETTIMPVTSTPTTVPTKVYLDYSYDPLDRVNLKQIFAGQVTSIESFGYDMLGRLSTDTNVLDSFTYTYNDATARVTGRTSGAGPQVAASYFPSQLPSQDGLLQELTYTTPSGSALAQYSYGYDVRHNVTSFTDSNVGQSTYGYDAYSQLSAANLPYAGTLRQSLSVVPDLSGNISSLYSYGSRLSSNTSFSIDSGNKLTQETVTTRTSFKTFTTAQPISYDSINGSLELIGTGSAQQQYMYDASNRLSRYALGTAFPPVQSSAFLYDGLGRLSQVIDFVPVPGSPYNYSQVVASHSYVWDGDRKCLEIDNTQQVSSDPNHTTGYLDAIYFAQGQVNDPTPGQTTPYPASQLAYDVTDMLGSERAVVTNNAIVAQYDYDTFGNRTTLLGSSTASSRGFTGFYYHATSGLQFARDRAYNASLGRWMTRDPSGNALAFGDPERFNATNLNLYSYADNNPQSMIDLSGDFPLPPDPSGLPPGWVRDYSDLAPNGEKYVFGNGDWLRFDRKQPGKPGWRGKDHWHHSSDPKRHLKPGREVPDPPAMCSVDAEYVAQPEADDMWDDDADQGPLDGSLMLFMAPVPLNPLGWLVGGPVGVGFAFGF